MKWTNSYRSFGLKTKRSTGLKTIEHKHMNTEEPPLQALEQAIAWAASHGGTDGLARHGDHGVRYTGTVYRTPG